MEIKDATVLRMYELAKEKNISINEITKRGNINQSTISEVLRGRSKHPRVSTINKFCKGCNIRLSEFFDSPLFDELLTEDEETEKKNSYAIKKK